jgi:hypothetical protein
MAGEEEEVPGLMTRLFEEGQYHHVIRWGGITLGHNRKSSFTVRAQHIMRSLGRAFKYT